MRLRPLRLTHRVESRCFVEGYWCETRVQIEIAVWGLAGHGSAVESLEAWCSTRWTWRGGWLGMVR